MAKNDNHSYEKGAGPFSKGYVHMTPHSEAKHNSGNHKTRLHHLNEGSDGDYIGRGIVNNNPPKLKDIHPDGTAGSGKQTSKSSLPRAYHSED